METAAALQASRHALRPLVRLFLSSGVMYQQAASLLKELFVDVASEDYGLRGRPTNASRVALLTGLDRKEVRRLRDRESAVQISRAQPDRLARILAAWHQHADFLDARGKPRRLARRGPHPSFETLVDRFGGDIPATAMLKELERAGAVDTASDGRVRARTRYYMIGQLNEAAVLRSGEVLEDLGDTVHHNLVRDDRTPSRFEGRATNRHVDRRKVKAFHEFVEREAEAFLEKVDQWLTDYESSKGKQAVRLGLGIYAIQGPSDSQNHEHKET
ncbi:MAG TPA: DUF6502 family protein [Gammaproteobacteria bacterium]|jgi:hypothetical protein